MLKTTAFLLCVVVMLSCTGAPPTSRLPPPETNPARFVGVWQASKTEYVNDNLNLYMADSKKYIPPEQYSQLRPSDHERNLGNAIADISEDQALDDVFSWLRFMDNRLVEMTYRKNDGTILAIYLYKWTFQKGEITLLADGQAKFLLYEFGQQLIKEHFSESKPRGTVKIRYNKVE